jgi:hypothetical protein
MTDFEPFKILIRIFSLKGQIFLLLLLVISMCIKTKKLQDDQYNEVIIIVDIFILQYLNMYFSIFLGIYGIS